MVPSAGRSSRTSRTGGPARRTLDLDRISLIARREPFRKRDVSHAVSATLLHARSLSTL
jgi:hypothetical protein